MNTPKHIPDDDPPTTKQKKNNTTTDNTSKSFRRLSWTDYEHLYNHQKNKQPIRYLFAPPSYQPRYTKDRSWWSRCLRELRSDICIRLDVAVRVFLVTFACIVFFLKVRLNFDNIYTMMTTFFIIFQPNFGRALFACYHNAVANFTCGVVLLVLRYYFDFDRINVTIIFTVATSLICLLWGSSVNQSQFKYFISFMGMYCLLIWRDNKDFLHVLSLFSISSGGYAIALLVTLAPYPITASAGLGRLSRRILSRHSKLLYLITKSFLTDRHGGLISSSSSQMDTINELITILRKKQKKPSDKLQKPLDHSTNPSSNNPNIKNPSTNNYNKSKKRNGHDHIAVKNHPHQFNPHANLESSQPHLHPNTNNQHHANTNAVFSSMTVSQRPHGAPTPLKPSQDTITAMSKLHRIDCLEAIDPNNASHAAIFDNSSGGRRTKRTTKPGQYFLRRETVDSPLPARHNEIYNEDDDDDGIISIFGNMKEERRERRDLEKQQSLNHQITASQSQLSRYDSNILTSNDGRKLDTILSPHTLRRRKLDLLAKNNHHNTRTNDLFSIDGIGNRGSSNKSKLDEIASMAHHFNGQYGDYSDYSSSDSEPQLKNNSIHIIQPKRNNSNPRLSSNGSTDCASSSELEELDDLLDTTSDDSDDEDDDEDDDGDAEEGYGTQQHNHSNQPNQHNNDHTNLIKQNTQHLHTTTHHPQNNLHDIDHSELGDVFAAHLQIDDTNGYFNNNSTHFNNYQQHSQNKPRVPPYYHHESVASETQPLLNQQQYFPQQQQQQYEQQFTPNSLALQDSIGMFSPFPHLYITECQVLIEEIQADISAAQALVPDLVVESQLFRVLYTIFCCFCRFRHYKEMSRRKANNLSPLPDPLYPTLGQHRTVIGAPYSPASVSAFLSDASSTLSNAKSMLTCLSTLPQLSQGGILLYYLHTHYLGQDMQRITRLFKTFVFCATERNPDLAAIDGMFLKTLGKMTHSGGSLDVFTAIYTVLTRAHGMLPSGDLYHHVMDRFKNKYKRAQQQKKSTVDEKSIPKDNITAFTNPQKKSSGLFDLFKPHDDTEQNPTTSTTTTTTTTAKQTGTPQINDEDDPMNIFKSSSKKPRQKIDIRALNKKLDEQTQLDLGAQPSQDRNHTLETLYLRHQLYKKFLHVKEKHVRGLSFVPGSLGALLHGMRNFWIGYSKLRRRCFVGKREIRKTHIGGYYQHIGTSSNGRPNHSNFNTHHYSLNAKSFTSMNSFSEGQVQFIPPQTRLQTVFQPPLFVLEAPIGAYEPLASLGPPHPSSDELLSQPLPTGSRVVSNMHHHSINNHNNPTAPSHLPPSSAHNDIFNQPLFRSDSNRFNHNLYSNHTPLHTTATTQPYPAAPQFTPFRNFTTNHQHTPQVFGFQHTLGHNNITPELFLHPNNNHNFHQNSQTQPQHRSYIEPDTGTSNANTPQFHQNMQGHPSAHYHHHHETITESYRQYNVTLTDIITLSTFFFNFDRFVTRVAHRLIPHASPHLYGVMSLVTTIPPSMALAEDGAQLIPNVVKHKSKTNHIPPPTTTAPQQSQQFFYPQQQQQQQQQQQPQSFLHPQQPHPQSYSQMPLHLHPTPSHSRPTLQPQTDKSPPMNPPLPPTISMFNAKNQPKGGALLDTIPPTQQPIGAGVEKIHPHQTSEILPTTSSSSILSGLHQKKQFQHNIIHPNEGIIPISTTILPPTINENPSPVSQSILPHPSTATTTTTASTTTTTTTINPSVPNINAQTQPPNTTLSSLNLPHDMILPFSIADLESYLAPAVIPDLPASSNISADNQSSQASINMPNSLSSTTHHSASSFDKPLISTPLPMQHPDLGTTPGASGTATVSTLQTTDTCPEITTTTTTTTTTNPTHIEKKPSLHNMFDPLPPPHSLPSADPLHQTGTLRRSASLVNNQSHHTTQGSNLSISIDVPETNYTLTNPQLRRSGSRRPSVTPSQAEAYDVEKTIYLAYVTDNNDVLPLNQVFAPIKPATSLKQATLSNRGADINPSSKHASPNTHTITSIDSLTFPNSLDRPLNGRDPIHETISPQSPTQALPAVSYPPIKLYSLSQPPPYFNTPPFIPLSTLYFLFVPRIITDLITFVQSVFFPTRPKPASPSTEKSTKASTILKQDSQTFTIGPNGNVPPAIAGNQSQTSTNDQTYHSSLVGQDIFGPQLPLDTIPAFRRLETYAPELFEEDQGEIAQPPSPTAVKENISYKYKGSDKPKLDKTKSVMIGPQPLERRKSTLLEPSSLQKSTSKAGSEPPSSLRQSSVRTTPTLQKTTSIPEVSPPPSITTNEINPNYHSVSININTTDDVDVDVDVERENADEMEDIYDATTPRYTHRSNNMLTLSRGTQLPHIAENGRDHHTNSTEESHLHDLHNNRIHFAFDNNNNNNNNDNNNNTTGASNIDKSIDTSVKPTTHFENSPESIITPLPLSQSQSVLNTHNQNMINNSNAKVLSPISESYEESRIIPTNEIENEAVIPSFWYRLKSGLYTLVVPQASDLKYYRMIVKCVVCILLAFCVIVIPNPFDQTKYVHWSTTTASMLIADSLSQTFIGIVTRVQATALGAFYGYFVVFLSRQIDPTLFGSAIYFAATMMALFTGFMIFYRLSPTANISFSSVSTWAGVIVVLGAIDNADTQSYALTRIEMTLLGCLAVLVSSLMLWPTSSYSRFLHSAQGTIGEICTVTKLHFKLLELTSKYQWGQSSVVFGPSLFPALLHKDNVRTGHVTTTHFSHSNTRSDLFSESGQVPEPNGLVPMAEDRSTVKQQQQQQQPSVQPQHSNANISGYHYDKTIYNLHNEPLITLGFEEPMIPREIEVHSMLPNDTSAKTAHKLNLGSPTIHITHNVNDDDSNNINSNNSDPDFGTQQDSLLGSNHNNSNILQDTFPRNVNPFSLKSPLRNMFHQTFPLLQCPKNSQMFALVYDLSIRQKLATLRSTLLTQRSIVIDYRNENDMFGRNLALFDVQLTLVSAQFDLVRILTRLQECLFIHSWILHRLPRSTGIINLDFNSPHVTDFGEILPETTDTSNPVSSRIYNSFDKRNPDLYTPIQSKCYEYNLTITGNNALQSLGEQMKLDSTRSRFSNEHIQPFGRNGHHGGNFHPHNGQQQQQQPPPPPPPQQQQQPNGPHPRSPGSQQSLPSSLHLKKEWETSYAGLTIFGDYGEYITSLLMNLIDDLGQLALDTDIDTFFGIPITFRRKTIQIVPSLNYGRTLQIFFDSIVDSVHDGMSHVIGGVFGHNRYQKQSKYTSSKIKNQNKNNSNVGGGQRNTHHSSQQWSKKDKKKFDKLAAHQQEMATLAATRQFLDNQESNSTQLKEKLKYYKVCNREKLLAQPGGARLGRGSYLSLWNWEFGPCWVTEELCQQQKQQEKDNEQAVSQDRDNNDAAKNTSKPNIGDITTTISTTQVDLNKHDGGDIEMQPIKLNTSPNNLNDPPPAPAPDLLAQINATKTMLDQATVELFSPQKTEPTTAASATVTSPATTSSSTPIYDSRKIFNDALNRSAFNRQLTEAQLDKQTEVLKLKQIFATISKIILLYEETLKARSQLAQRGDTIQFPSIFIQLEMSFVFIMCCIPNILLTLTVAVNTLRANDKRARG